MLSSKTSSLITALTLLTVSACQTTGNGGGGPIVVPKPPPFQPPPPPYDAPATPSISAEDPFNTVEFNKNYGLLAMNTHSVYGQGISGEGIIVAIVDDGIDLDHPDLIDNISPLSIDIVSGNFEDVDADEDDPHGTQLAGIIAAVKNDTGVHGVAYNAIILAIKAVGDPMNTTQDVADGIDYAVANGARVINLSLTVAALPSSVRLAMDRAVEAGVLIVISAGNNLIDSPDRASLDAMSKYATLLTSNGQAIAVGAIDSDNNLSPFSNRPGEEGQNIYLLAPGIDIISTTLGGGIWILNSDPDPKFYGMDLFASGTSFAAPHVAGAAALMFEMFPNLTAKEVVELLLDGATDVGAAGVDAITGHGIINLGASIQPQGVMSIPMGMTSMANNIAMTQTLFLPSPIFGDAFSISNAFEGGFFQDRYRRAYGYDFRNLIPDPDISIRLSAHVDARRGNRVIPIRIGPNTILQVNIRDINWWQDGEGQRSYIRGDILSGRKLIMSAFISQSKITNSMTLEVRHGFQKSSLGDFAMGFKEIHPLNYGNNLSGFDNIAGFGTHVKVRQMLGAGHGFEVSVSSTIRENQLTSGSELTSSVSVKYKGRIGKNFNFGVEVGQLQEVGRLLGSTSFGAFGGFDNSQTTFGSFAASYKIKAFTFFGTISNGSTQINQHTLGLLKEFSSLKTNAFKFGLALGNPFQTNGQLSLSVTQPLRVSSGTALVDIATGLNRWDIITREIRTLSLAPKGHELDFSVAYKVDLKGFSFIANLLHRMNPGHVAKSHSDTSILLHLFTDF